MPGDLYQDFVESPATRLLQDAAEGNDMEVRLARARGKSRAEGFADGAASAEATFDREMLMRVNAVSEALSNFAAERTATDAATLEALRRIVAETITAFTPTLADTALPALVAETVTKAIAAETTGAVVVQTTADRLSDLQNKLRRRDARISFVEDTQIAPGTARVLWRGGFDQIDATAAIKAGAALLDERLRTAAATNAKKDTTS